MLFTLNKAHTKCTSLLYSRLVSCPTGNNLWKIRLVTLRAFLGLLHTSAGFEHGQRWPYMDVLTSTEKIIMQIHMTVVTCSLGSIQRPQFAEIITMVTGSLGSILRNLKNRVCLDNLSSWPDPRNEGNGEPSRVSWASTQFCNSVT